MQNKEREAVRDRQRASLFDAAMREMAEPTAVFSALKEACQRRAALKSNLDPDELDWMRGILKEGEAALAAMRSLIQTADQNARIVEGLRLKNRFRQRKMWMI